MLLVKDFPIGNFENMHKYQGMMGNIQDAEVFLNSFLEYVKEHSPQTDPVPRAPGAHRRREQHDVRRQPPLGEQPAGRFGVALPAGRQRSLEVGVVGLPRRLRMSHEHEGALGHRLSPSVKPGLGRRFRH